MKSCFKNKLNLYFITSQEYSRQRDTLTVAKAAAKAGIDILQMREKTLASHEKIALGKKLSTLCKVHTIVFIVNDDVTIAKEVNADGVHLGQEDINTMPVEKARKIIGNDKIIGISTHSLKQVKIANGFDIDYIGFGPLFATKTKDYSIGTGELEKVLAVSRVPVVCIGGINSGNIPELMRKGARNIAVIREITEAADIALKVKELKKIINCHE